MNVISKYHRLIREIEGLYELSQLGGKACHFGDVLRLLDDEDFISNLYEAGYDKQLNYLANLRTVLQIRGLA